MFARIYFLNSIFFERRLGKFFNNCSFCSQRTASSGSVGSFDSASFKSADSGAFTDAPRDLFDEPTLQKPATVSPDPHIDLFAHVNSQPSSENVGWATFDSPPIKSPHSNGFNSSHKVPSSNQIFAPLTELFPGDFNGPISSSDLTNNNAQVRDSSRLVNYSHTSTESHKLTLNRLGMLLRIQVQVWLRNMLLVGLTKSRYHILLPAIPRYWLFMNQGTFFIEGLNRSCSSLVIYDKP